VGRTLRIDFQDRPASRNRAGAWLFAPRPLDYLRCVARWQDDLKIGVMLPCHQEGVMIPLS